MKIPRQAGVFHIIGIGGIGMSAIAEVMQAQGYTVQGSDLNESANVERLRNMGLRVFVGHQPENLAGVTHVVISSAVKPGNPELDAARERGLPVIRRAEMLAELMRDRATISITGTHGKTTTTSLVAWTLEQAGTDPTVINGGILNAWGSNARTGDGDWMVVEADESDGTFVQLPTQIGVVTNIDLEHMDFYGSEQVLHDTFRRFFTQIPFYGALVAGIDHPVVRQLVDEARDHFRGRRLLTYGRAEDADIRLKDASASGRTIVFNAQLGERMRGGARRLEGLRLSVPGEYNALNALAVIAVANEIGIADDAIAEALESFGGVARRFTHTGDWNGVSIYDDYAHHPVEIAAVLKAARSAASGRVIAVMQPHRYSRLTALLDEFGGCFGDADIAVITPVYAAGETANGIDRDTLINELKQNGHPHVVGIDDEDMLVHTIGEIARPGDLVIGLGAGTISAWARNLPARLHELSAVHMPRAGAAE